MLKKRVSVWHLSMIPVKLIELRQNPFIPAGSRSFLSISHSYFVFIILHSFFTYSFSKSKCWKAGIRMTPQHDSSKTHWITSESVHSRRFPQLYTNFSVISLNFFSQNFSEKKLFIYSKVPGPSITTVLSLIYYSIDISYKITKYYFDICFIFINFLKIIWNFPFFYIANNITYIQFFLNKLISRVD